MYSEPLEDRDGGVVEATSGVLHTQDGYSGAFIMDAYQ